MGGKEKRGDRERRFLDFACCGGDEGGCDASADRV
jgi:hypothetical protein